MSDPRPELDQRLLAEARVREQGRTFRRVLLLVASAVVIVALGARGTEATLAYGAAAACLVVAGIVLWKAWKDRPPR